MSGYLWGSLDCVHCGAADERTAFNAWMHKTLTDPDAPDEGDGWIIYQHAKAAALEQAAKVCEEIPVSGYEDKYGMHDDAEETLADAAKAIRALKP